MKTITKLKDMDTTLLLLALMDEVAEIGTEDQRGQVIDALVIASSLHINDFRRSPRSNVATPPYMEHVLRVALRPVKYFTVTDVNVIIAGLLHDTVEDHARDFYPGEDLDEGTARERMLAEIATRFNPEVADAVTRLTNPIIDESTPGTIKRELYREHVTTVTVTDPVALIVKVSDFIDNAGSLHITHAGTVRGATNHLVSKYTPLVDVFISAVGSLLSPAQAEPMIARLERVRGGLASLT